MASAAHSYNSPLRASSSSSSSPAFLPAILGILVVSSYLLQTFIGPQRTVGVIALAGTAYLLYTHEMEQRRVHAEEERGTSEGASLQELVNNDNNVDDPNRAESIPPPPPRVVPGDQLSNLVTPQDAPYQVPLTDLKTFMYIPRHAEVLPLLSALHESMRRRPASVKLALALLERFLELYAWLSLKFSETSVGPKMKKAKNKKEEPSTRGISNSVLREVIKQRVQDMPLLRLEMLEQLQSSLFEFQSSCPNLKRAIKSLSAYTHRLVVQTSSEWAIYLPSLGYGVEAWRRMRNSHDSKRVMVVENAPNGVDARDLTLKNVSWSVYL
jgi:hypothetical protein